MREQYEKMLKYLAQYYDEEIDINFEVGSWMFVFEEEDYETVRKAVIKWIKNEKRMPKPSDINGLIEGSLSNVDEWKPKYDMMKLWDEEKVDEPDGIPFDEWFDKYFKKH